MTYRPASNVRIVQTPTGAFIVDYVSSKCLMLNRTGQTIWSYLEHGASAESIRARMVEEFEGVTSEMIAADVDRFLDRLKAHALIKEDE